MPILEDAARLYGCMRKGKSTRAIDCSYHDPFNPILWLASTAYFDQRPVVVDFLLRLEPVPRVSEKISGMQGDYGLSS